MYVTLSAAAAFIAADYVINDLSLSLFSLSLNEAWGFFAIPLPALHSPKLFVPGCDTLCIKRMKEREIRELDRK